MLRSLKFALILAQIVVLRAVRRRNFVWEASGWAGAVAFARLESRY